MALHVNIFAALADHFDDPSVRENVARVFGVVVRYDVRKFDADSTLYGYLNVLSGVFNIRGPIFSISALPRS